MITAQDKLVVHRVAKGSSEAHEMWDKLDRGEREDYGISIKTKPCPVCNGRWRCYNYIGTFHRSHSAVTNEYRMTIPGDYQFVHVFRHEKHPITNRPVIRVIPASLGWEP